MDLDEATEAISLIVTMKFLTVSYAYLDKTYFLTACVENSSFTRAAADQMSRHVMGGA